MNIVMMMFDVDIYSGLEQEKSVDFYVVTQYFLALLNSHV